MTHTPDPDATPQAQDAGLSAEVRPARPTLRDQIAENPLLSLFLGLVFAIVIFFETALAVILLVFLLTST